MGGDAEVHGVFRPSPNFTRGNAFPGEPDELLASVSANLQDTFVYRLLYPPDGRMRCAYVSTNIVSLLGIPAEVLKDDPERALDFVEPEDLPRMREGLVAGVANRAPVVQTVRVRSRDGSQRCLEFRSRYIDTLEDGTQVRDGVAIDVTQKKETEAEINKLNAELQELVAQRTAALAVANVSRIKTEQRYRAVFENSPMMIALLSVPEGRIIEINQAITDNFGYTPEEAIGRTSTDLRLWAFEIDRDQYLAKLKRDSSVEGFEALMRRKNGQIFPAVFHSTLVHLNGETFSLNSLQSIETQRETEDRFKNLITQSPLGYYRTTVEGRIILANPALLRMLRYDSVEELSSRDLNDPKWFVDRPRQDYLDELDAKGELRGLESSWQRSDGSELRIREHARCVRNPAGETLYFEGTVEDVTARYEAEKALRESEERWKLVVEGLGDGAWDWDIVNDTVRYSSRWLEMLGYEANEEPEPWETRVHPEDIPLAQAVVKQALLEPSPAFKMELRMRTKSGAYKWILSRGLIPSWDDQGRPLRMVGSHSDITERKQIEERVSELNERLEERVWERTQELEHEIKVRRDAEEKLIKSETQYRRVVDGAREVIIELDHEGRIEFLNPAWEEATGYEVTEVIGRHFLEFVHPDDRAERKERLARRMKGYDRLGSTNIRLVTHAGQIRWFESHARTRYDSEERPNGVTGIMLDKTEQWRAEQELRASEQRYELAVAASRDGVWDWDLLTNEVYYSPRWEQLMGFEIGTAPRTLATFHGTVHPGDKFACLLKVQRFIRGQIPHCRQEIRMIRRDGSVRWTLQRVEAIRDANGRAFRLIGVTADITSRQQADAELRQRSNELEAANQELEAFSYSVSHDLRAPLRGIDGWSLALVVDHADQLSPDAHQMIDRVRNEAQRMGKLIDGLLQLARTNRNTMARKELDLTALAERIEKSLRKAQPEHNVQWTVEPGLSAMVDPYLTESLLGNLLGNAWKFTSQTLKPTVEMGRTETADGPAFFIKDNGAGFDTAYADKLFSPFQRMHKQSEFPGTGIGLATVQRIVRRHGGRVWADSKPGQGAVFYFTLPPI